MTTDETDKAGQHLSQDETIVIVVRGTPKPQPRPRFVGPRGKARVVGTADRETKSWSERVRIAARSLLADRYGSSFPGFAGALQVDLCFVLPIKDPKRHGEFCTAKPDKDNLEKLVMDALERAGLFFVGDQQIVVGQVMKLYGPEKHAGVSITISPPRCDAVSGMLVLSGATTDIDKPDWLA